MAWRAKTSACSCRSADGGSAGPGLCSSYSRAILAAEKYLASDQASSWSHITAPASLSRDFSEGNTCTTRLRRLISRLARSWTLLVLSLFQWSWGKSR